MKYQEAKGIWGGAREGAGRPRINGKEKARHLAVTLLKTEWEQLASQAQDGKRLKEAVRIIRAYLRKAAREDGLQQAQKQP